MADRFRPGDEVVVRAGTQRGDPPWDLGWATWDPATLGP